MNETFALEIDGKPVAHIEGTTPVSVEIDGRPVWPRATEAWAATTQVRMSAVVKSTPDQRAWMHDFRVQQWKRTGCMFLTLPDGRDIGIPIDRRLSLDEADRVFAREARRRFRNWRKAHR
jgi:hypothetical protein